MFYYFGRKGRLARHYPKPSFDLIIEPFAGSMAFSLAHQPKKAIGFEIDQNVYDVWNKVCSLTKEQIDSYADPIIDSRVDDRWAMMAGGSHGTSKAKSYLWTERMSRDFKKQKRMASKCLQYANGNIDYKLGSYTEAPDIEATWFIDPPYQKVIRGYERNIDYAKLSEWCQTRKGLVIVCEQSGADWLPFEPLIEIKGTNNKKTIEVYWTNKKD